MAAKTDAAPAETHPAFQSIESEVFAAVRGERVLAGPFATSADALAAVNAINSARTEAFLDGADATVAVVVATTSYGRVHVFQGNYSDGATTGEGLVIGESGVWGPDATTAEPVVADGAPVVEGGPVAGDAGADPNPEA